VKRRKGYVRADTDGDRFLFDRNEAEAVDGVEACRMKLAKRHLYVDPRGPLGCGAQGCAYETYWNPDGAKATGDVLKVTVSTREANMAERLRRESKRRDYPKALPKIKSVFSGESCGQPTVFFIVREGLRNARYAQERVDADLLEKASHLIDTAAHCKKTRDTSSCGILKRGIEWLSSDAKHGTPAGRRNALHFLSWAARKGFSFDDVRAMGNIGVREDGTAVVRDFGVNGGLEKRHLIPLAKLKLRRRR
jgi:hypothetical protein